MLYCIRMDVRVPHDLALEQLQRLAWTKKLSAPVEPHTVLF